MFCFVEMPEKLNTAAAELKRNCRMDRLISAEVHKPHSTRIARAPLSQKAFRFDHTTCSAMSYGPPGYSLFILYKVSFAARQEHLVRNNWEILGHR